MLIIDQLKWRRNRHATLVLLVLFLLIQLFPCAPVLLKNSRIAHALTGECAQDCRICGCDPAKSAERSCCCWKKKRLQQEQAAGKADCCGKQKKAKVTVIKCSCPCGNGKHLALLQMPNSELLPYAYHSELPASMGDGLNQDHPRRLSSRYGDPPDPPPRLLQIS